ncbi:MAG: hypothetical protein JST55_16995 [Bacteroidetes bacterium]|nr:hypothetical protein [Bacteroidota bacterium]
MKKILLLIIVFTSFNLYSQNLNIELNSLPFTILTDVNEPVLGASVTTGVYSAGLGLNLESIIGTDNTFTKPEALILADFKAKKNRDKTAMLSLYDDESKLMADSKTDIDKAAEAYKDFKDFELISQNSVGDFLRIRYNLIRNSGGFSPWVAMIRKTNGRYYLTETVPLTGLFILTSSSHPNNNSTAPYVPLETSGMEKLNFVSEGFSDKQGYSDAKEKNIEVFFKCIKDGSSSRFSILNDMKNALLTGDKDKYLNTWNAEERKMLAGNDNFESNFNLQKDFYNRVKEIIPMGYLQTNDESVLFFKVKIDETTSVYQAIPVININGKYFLKSALSNYYGWAIINHPLVKAGIFNFLEK